MIKINRNELAIIIAAGGESLTHPIAPSNSSVISYINNTDVDEVINLLGDYFCLKGLREDDEPNSLGLDIETLIDKLISEGAEWKG